MSHPTPPRVSFADLAWLFLRLSLTAFGGPVAHMAMGEDEIVRRRRWLTREHFLDLIAVTNLIPGPNSTEVMIHVGYTMRGIPGAILAGICFIGPAFLLTLALAVLYVSSGSIPQAGAILWGIKPVIVAIIASAGYRLMVTALRTPALWALCGVSALAIVLLEIPEVVVMLGVGVIHGLLVMGWKDRAVRALPLFFALPPIVQQVTETAARAGLGDVFWYFLKIGSVLFGSGYVLIVYIQQDLVNRFGWLSSQELLDAIAIGQITPGPLSTTAAVVGYIVHGLPGALLATFGIFLPSFVLVILTAPLIPRMRSNAFLGAFLAGVNAGVIAAIGLTLVDLAQAAVRVQGGQSFSPVAVLLAAGALLALVRTNVNATVLIGVGGVVGLAMGFIG